VSRNRRCDLWTILRISKAILVAVCEEHARTKVVHGYSFGGDLPRDIAHKILLRRFRCGIHAHFRMGAALVDRTENDEPSPLLRLHFRIAPLKHPERRKEIDLHFLLSLIKRELRPRNLRLN